VEHPRSKFVMLALVRDARLIWTGVLAQVGLLASDAASPESVDVNGRVARDTPRLTAAVIGAIAEDALRYGLRDVIAVLAADTEWTLGRWAAVMLNADVYAEVIDRHVELVGDIGWLSSLLDNADPPGDHLRYRRATSSPAVQIEGQIGGEELARRIVVITQLAEELDRNTLELARRIVPLEWWQSTARRHRLALSRLIMCRTLRRSPELETGSLNHRSEGTALSRASGVGTRVHHGCDPGAAMPPLDAPHRTDSKDRFAHGRTNT
jgi:hypothetical protein